MKYIKLTQNKRAVVDDKDYEILNKVKWHYSDYGKTGYAKRYNPNKKPYLLRMHRVILSAPKGMEVDHINGDGLDNRRENLRLATRAQNTLNRHLPPINNTSGYKGVAWHKQNKRWRAYITVKYKQISLGLYDTKKEAAIAWNIAAIKYYGDFAHLNKII